MISKVSFTRFRGFSGVAVPLAPVSVLLGPNSSGKTSVLHAIRLAAAALRAAIEDEEAIPSVKGSVVHVCSDLVVRDHTRLMRVRDWTEIFSGGQVGEGIDATITLDFDAASPLQQLEVRLSYARNAMLKMSVQVTSANAAAAVAGIPPKSSKRASGIRQELRKIQPIAVLIPAFYGVILEEEYRSKAAQSQLLEGGEQSRIVRNLISRLDVGAFERLNSFLFNTVGAKLSYCTPTVELEQNEHLEVRFSDGNGDLELCSAGAGLVNLVALFASLERYKTERTDDQPIVFLLDEPDAHLHPKLQGEIGVAIAKLAAQYGAQLVLATHSVEMINRLGQREGTALIQVDRAKSLATQLKSENEVVQELGAWCDLTPFASINFLSSRKVLFHEGITDAEVLTRCAEVYFKADPIKARRFSQWTLISLDGTGSAGAADVLVRTLTPQLFPALGSGPKASVVRVLDRDASRAPGMTSTEGAVVVETQVVWSGYSIESLFLTPECLAAWMAPAVDHASADVAALSALVKGGLSSADTDNALEDFAVDNLAAHLRKSHEPQDALAIARVEARKDPATRQSGKARAKHVLKKVREGLPPTLQNKVRASLPAVLSAIDVTKTGDPEVLVPLEIRRLLDFLGK